MARSLLKSACSLSVLLFASVCIAKHKQNYGAGALLFPGAVVSSIVDTKSKAFAWEEKTRFTSMVTFLNNFDQHPKQTCHLVHCENTSQIVANMCDGNVIAILRPNLSRFLHEVSAQGKEGTVIVLVTFNYDNAFTNIDAAAVFRALPRVLSIFANNALSENSAVHAIPLGLPYHRLCSTPAQSCRSGEGERVLHSKVQVFEAGIQFCRESSRRQPNSLFIPYMSETHSSRSQIVNILRRDIRNLSVTFGEKRDNFVEYLCDFAKHDFVLSSRGAGPDTFRNCEILAAGSCPVFIQDKATKVSDMYTTSTCAVMFQDVDSLQVGLSHRIDFDAGENGALRYDEQLGLCDRNALISHVRSFAPASTS